MAAGVASPRSRPGSTLPVRGRARRPCRPPCVELRVGPGCVWNGQGARECRGRPRGSRADRAAWHWPQQSSQQLPPHAPAEAAAEDEVPASGQDAPGSRLARGPTGSPERPRCTAPSGRHRRLRPRPRPAPRSRAPLCWRQTIRPSARYSQNHVREPFCPARVRPPALPLVTLTIAPLSSRPPPPLPTLHRDLPGP